MNTFFRSFTLFFIFILAVGTATAEGIGKVKVLSGSVSIERSGDSVLAKLGAPVYQTDKIITGKGSIGLLFNDDSRISAGPNSTLSLNQFSFDAITHEGNFDVSVNEGTLSVISGKLTAKRPGALKVKTPAAILAVRGTEFSIKVDPAEKKVP